MNPRPCAVPRCPSVCGPKTYSPYCQSHRLAQTRHGHPLQTAVTFYELAPYMDTVKATMGRNASNDLWRILSVRWARLVEHASRIVAERDTGKAFHRPSVQAAEMLLQVAKHADEKQVFVVTLALYLLEDAHPNRFRSDRAFLFALVRRLRHLAPMARYVYWNHKLRRMSSVYRDAPPRAVEIAGGWLVEVFGLAGKLTAEAGRSERSRVSEERAAIAGAVARLT